MVLGSTYNAMGKKHVIGNCSSIIKSPGRGISKDFSQVMTILANVIIIAGPIGPGWPNKARLAQ